MPNKKITFAFLINTYLTQDPTVYVSLGLVIGVNGALFIGGDGESLDMHFVANADLKIKYKFYLLRVFVSKFGWIKYSLVSLIFPSASTKL